MPKKRETRTLSLVKFLDTISRLIPPRDDDSIVAAVARLNPDAFYLENVRQILGVSTNAALNVCETAVRQGIFSERVVALTPDGAVAASAPTENQLPQTISIWAHADNGEEETEVSVTDLTKMRVYSLK